MKNPLNVSSSIKVESNIRNILLGFVYSKDTMRIVVKISTRQARFNW